VYLRISNGSPDRNSVNAVRFFKMFVITYLMDDKDQYQYAAGNSDSQSENIQQGDPFVLYNIP